MVESKRDELKMDPQILQQIINQVEEHISPEELSSVDPESCTTPIEDDSMICGVCKRVPIDPVQDENCD